MSSKDKSAQSAIEFLVGIGVVLIFFTLVIIFFTQRFVMVEVSQNEKSLEQISELIREELFIAKSSSGNYDRNFTLPTTIAGQDVLYEVFNGRDVSISIDQMSYVVFLPSFVYGNFSPGENTIIKRGSLIGFCSDNCSLDALFNSSGLLQCAEVEGAWAPCDFEFGDAYVGIRSFCNKTFLNLTMYNVDDNKTMYTNISSEVDGSFRLFDFSRSPFKINESGLWNVTSKCQTDPIRINEFDVPYGVLTFQPIIIGGCVFSPFNTSYNCTEDINFTMTARIECSGGECGETIVWADPVSTS